MKILIVNVNKFILVCVNWTLSWLLDMTVHLGSSFENFYCTTGMYEGGGEFNTEVTNVHRGSIPDNAEELIRWEAKHTTQQLLLSSQYSQNKKKQFWS